MNKKSTNRKLMAILLCCLLVIPAISGWTQDSLNCTLVGRWPNGFCNDLEMVGNTVYYGNGGYLQLLIFQTRQIQLS